MHYFELQIVGAEKIEGIVAPDRKRKLSGSIEYLQVSIFNNLQSPIDMLFRSSVYRDVVQSRFIHLERVRFLSFPDVDRDSLGLNANRVPAYGDGLPTVYPKYSRNGPKKRIASSKSETVNAT